jgi:hypothetical protein
LADGGRNAAQGLRYQYLRTLEALMDAAEAPGRGVVAVHVEGLPDPGGAGTDSIDYELSDVGGHVVSAVQVKARVRGTVMGAGQVFKALAGLVRDRDAARYELLTSAEAGDSARDLVSVLGMGLLPDELRAAIDTILASVSADQPRELLADLAVEHLTRLGRASAEFDSRDDAEISESLRLRLRRYRNGARAGLGNESAGLVVGYLISEIFRRAGSPAEATVSVAGFRSLLMVDGAALARALGRRDWGVVVGPLPAVPDVRRADILDRMEAALPLQNAAAGAVSRCTLTGMSGIGKTSLAVGYLLDRADVYDAIFWAHAESEQTLAASFSRIFRFLHGDDAPEPSDSAALRDAVLTELSCVAGRWLLILDNCTDERLADGWVPQAGSGHVLTTTVNSARTPQSDARIEVTAMSAVQAVDLLRRRLVSDMQPDGPQLSLLVQLARELEGWPLALELACAYLHGSGLGIDGIPEYLDRLKLISLGDPESVPRGYPNTLIQAIGLCVQRIRQKADDPDSPGAWAATYALGVLRIAAYMSSRQIPVYLVMSVPEVDLGEEAFRDVSPVVVDDPEHPPAEVVRTLRAYSLVAVDERLPPDGLNDASDRRYDYAIAINSVLQDVMRDSYDSDQFTGLIVDRLAWHTHRWMFAAFEAGAPERALVLAAHASALEGHAARLNLRTDFVAYLRGNLASVQFRQNKKDQVIQLLRSEIDHYRGRSEEHARLLTCQASIQLAAVLADDLSGTADEIADLLETAYLGVLSFVPLNPEGMPALVANIESILNQLQLRDVRHERLAMLTAAVRDLAGQLPDTPLARAARTLDEIWTCMHDHSDCRRAASLARALLASDLLPEGIQETMQVRAMARRSLIEALAAEHDIEEALAELDRFTADTQPPSMFVREIQELVHNTGYSSALFSLVGIPSADELLARLLSDGRAEMVQSAYPGQIATRIRLLCGVNAFHRSDLALARKYVGEFLETEASSDDEASPEWGWRRLARILADRIGIRENKGERLVRSGGRMQEDSGFGRLLLFVEPVQEILISCHIELLPLLTALALIHRELTGAPGACCVPVCWQLQGGLEYLGFDSEVIAASSLVMRDGDNRPEQIGHNNYLPSLRNDGSTDGHAVVWAASFGQLVDPTIVRARNVQAVAQSRPEASFPVMLPVADRDTLFGPAAICSSSRPTLTFMWGLLPQWTQALTPCRGSDLETAIAYGKLALAHAIVEVIRGLNIVRPDSEQLCALYPPLAALLNGSSQLPRLPDEPPAAFVRLRLAR